MTYDMYFGLHLVLTSRWSWTKRKTCGFNLGAIDRRFTFTASATLNPLSLGAYVGVSLQAHEGGPWPINRDGVRLIVGPLSLGFEMVEGRMDDLRLAA